MDLHKVNQDKEIWYIILLILTLEEASSGTFKSPIKNNISELAEVASTAYVAKCLSNWAVNPCIGNNKIKSTSPANFVS